ncbi:MAG: filamentous hemagglutinin N-terminal domain-containing protein [Leptolyngbyaceae cyanobacterium MO_188.B28]|nr:filamentous hemagglutinin N-terminal domain-containing protein [Leptolyngbyaceae cyanobacterium MO_188.B28]
MRSSDIVRLASPLPTFVFSLLFPILGFFPDNSASAEVIPDSSLGSEASSVRSTVDPNNVPIELIEGGARRGANLFHSFDQFSIGEGQSVYFSNPTDIQLIMGRVTGGDSSTILGTLGVLGKADLFLMNPNGIVFGPDAALDLNGSFLATTSSSLIFEEGYQFSAINPSAPPMLTVRVPVGLQFGETAGSIRNQSLTTRFISPPSFPAFKLKTLVGLEVKPGNTLALVGSGVTMDGGFLASENGRIELGSVEANSRVNLRPIDLGWELSYEDTKSFQDIEFAARTRSAGIFANGGGEDSVINLRGRNVVLKDGSRILGSEVNMSVVASETVELIGVSPSSSIASSFVSDTLSDRNAGDITIETKRLILRDGGRISTNSTGIITNQFFPASGGGGNLIVNASESVELAGDKSGLFAETQALGAAGSITLNTHTLSILDGARVSTVSEGITPFFGQPLETGPGGDINIINAEFVELDRGFLSTETRGLGGEAGDLSIEAERLSIRNGAQVSASTAGVGNAGDIIFNVLDSITISGQDSGVFANTAVGSAGAGGGIIIDPRLITVKNGAWIAVDSQGSGPGGDIQVEAGTLLLDSQAFLSAETASSQGGNITLRLTDLLLLRRNSRISTTAGTAGTGGDGGNIDIVAGLVAAVFDENSDITANAFEGRGGRVEITTNSLFGLQFRSRAELQALLNTNDSAKLDPGLLASSDITAISQGNPNFDGQVIINSPDIDPNQGIDNLPSELATLQLNQRCYASASPSASSFINTGRGGLPPGLDAVHNTATVWDDLRPPTSQSNSSRDAAAIAALPPDAYPAQIVEAQGWFVDADGRVVLTSRVNSDNTYRGWRPSASCSS